MDLKNQIGRLSLITLIMILVFSGLDSYSQTKKVQPKTTQKSYCKLPILSTTLN
jgi:hypothetical protein